MARTVLPLTNTKIKNAKPKDKKYKLSDGRGLFLQINPNGSKLWRLNYRFNDKQKEYAIGVYPDITLLEARAKREELRNLIANGTDISELKKEKKENSKIIETRKKNTFFKVSQEWHKNYASEVSENYHGKLEKALENYIYPFIKNKSIDTITRLDIIEILQDLKNKDLKDTADRVHMLLNKIYKYAVTKEYTLHNIIADIDKKTIIGKITKKHYPTFTKEKDIKGLLLAIDDYKGDYSTNMALKILPYLFVRSYNIRHMEWVEIDFESNEWIIPKNKMKTKIEFILPLPHQVIEILKQMKENEFGSKYVFPSSRDINRPMSDNTLISALRRLGYSKEEFVPHSFRSIFSTIAYEYLNKDEKENGHTYQSEVIEALLAHTEKNAVKDAYNHATYKEPKEKLIQWYADFIDKLKGIENK